MGFLVAIIVTYLWLNLETLRNRVGHYPGDAVAIAAWRLTQAIKNALFAWGLLWALVAFTQFVLEGDFLLWLTHR
jgi:hypothetical protein